MNQTLDSKKSITFHCTMPKTLKLVYFQTKRIKKRKKKDIYPGVLELCRPRNADTYHVYDKVFEPDEDAGLAPSYVVTRPSFATNRGDQP